MQLVYRHVADATKLVIWCALKSKSHRWVKNNNRRLWNKSIQIDYSCCASTNIRLTTSSSSSYSVQWKFALHMISDNISLSSPKSISKQHCVLLLFSVPLPWFIVDIFFLLFLFRSIIVHGTWCLTVADCCSFFLLHGFYLQFLLYNVTKTNEKTMLPSGKSQSWANSFIDRF